jgi:hypothetical protein
MHKRYNNLKVNVLHLRHNRKECVALIAMQAEKGPNADFEGFRSLPERCMYQLRSKL